MKNIFFAFAFFAMTSKGFTQPVNNCYSSQRFYYSSTSCDPKMMRACTLADSVLSLSSFWLQVCNASDQNITNSKYTMKRLADTLQTYKDVTVLELLPNQDEGITTAGTFEANHTKIYRGGYEQSASDLALTIIHEWVHSVDYGVNPGSLQFAHRRPQYRWWNKNTASYRIEYIAQKFLP